MGKVSKYGAGFAQGELKKFGQLFVAPLLHHRARTMTFDDFVEQTIFHQDERIIIRCRVKRAFTMPGLWKLTATRLAKNGAPRNLKREQECFVRYDTTSPDRRVEIETYLGQGGREYVFELASTEWNSIKNNLIPRGDDRLKFDLIAAYKP